MHLLTVNSINNSFSFLGQDDRKSTPVILPILNQDVFERRGVQEPQVTRPKSNTKLQQKINYFKLKKLFLRNGSFESKSDINKDAEQSIMELAKLDYNTVLEKYVEIQDNLTQRYKIKNKKSIVYSSAINFYNIRSLLLDKDFTPTVIDDLFNLKDQTESNGVRTGYLDIGALADSIILYKDFDNASSEAQKSFIIHSNYPNGCYCTISKADADAIPEDSSLLQFSYIKDLRAAESKDDFVQKLVERTKNTPCKPIMTNSSDMERVLSDDGIIRMRQALNKTVLRKYETGFPLEYPRENFIRDFNALTENLSKDERERLFNHFQFRINKDNDMIGYPNPNTSKSDDDDQITILAQGLIGEFMLENKVKLDPKDKELEDVLNDTIKAFPEFISVIGKPQHRGDSVDYHTFDDMRHIMNDSRFDELEPNEQKILMVATLFHDFGKAQDKIDEEHANKSALYTKEIIKKTPMTFDEKERVFNLIKHSHWLVDGSENDDIAFWFRRPNDFKMAEIFEQADSNSAGFTYSPNTRDIADIKKKIDFINSFGIPIFADSLPKDPEKYDVNQHGVRYIDLRDPEASVEKYGYPKGTKVKDLKFLCHSTNEETYEFEKLCDDSKNACISTMLMDYRKRFLTRFNDGDNYIISGSNANIIIGAKNTNPTGRQRGIRYAKDCVYQNKNLIKEYYLIPYRKYVSSMIRDRLDLSKKDYLEVFNHLCNLENLEDIEDIELSNGRVLKSENVVETISDIRDYMACPNGTDAYGYKIGDPHTFKGYSNEFVVFNPKIEARVVTGDIDSYKESSVPLVLV